MEKGRRNCDRYRFLRPFIFHKGEIPFGDGIVSKNINSEEISYGNVDFLLTFCLVYDKFKVTTVKGGRRPWSVESYGNLPTSRDCKWNMPEHTALFTDTV